MRRHDWVDIVSNNELILCRLYTWYDLSWFHYVARIGMLVRVVGLVLEHIPLSKANLGFEDNGDLPRQGRI